MELKRIYIAGRISGQQAELCSEKFKTAALAVRQLGFEAQNPFEMIGEINRSRRAKGLQIWTDAKDRQIIMRTCIRSLMKCYGIYMLPDWQKSKGAQLEHATAKLFEMPIYYSIEELTKATLHDTATND